MIDIDAADDSKSLSLVEKPKMFAKINLLYPDIRPNYPLINELCPQSSFSSPRNCLDDDN